MNKRKNVKEIPQQTLRDCVEYYPKHFSAAKCAEYKRRLLSTLEFSQGEVRMYGEMKKEPRLTCFAATDTSKPYVYAGKTNVPVPMTAALMEIKSDIEALFGRGIVFDSVLVNKYEHGLHNIGWHSDDEQDIDRTRIGSVSFGATRTFRMRLRSDHAAQKDYELADGDVLLMKGRCQDLLQHQVPKRTRCRAMRLNLTFRCLKKQKSAQT